MRPPDVARLVLGTVALVRPAATARAVGARPGGSVEDLVRVLGARYLLQVAVGAWSPARWVPTADAVIDLLHAGSMAVVALRWPRHRRPAVASGAVALVLAAADLGDGGRPGG